MKKPSTLSRLVPLALLLIGTGCSATNDIDYGSVNLVAVGGNVMLDGKALPGAVITFEDPETGNFSFARTDSSGNYNLQFDSQANGVIAGKKLVRVSTTRNILGLAGEEGKEEGESSSEGEPEKAKADTTELVPDCYYKKSALNVEVTSSTTTFDFDLKSDCSTTGAK